MVFHESLPTLLRAAIQAGIPIDRDTLVVRDVTGRLSLARAVVSNLEEAREALKSALGAYCAPVPIVVGTLTARLLKDPATRIIHYIDEGVNYTFSQIDRRVVGADWLIKPARTPHEKPPRLVFASLKGGVGRTTALTILAAELAFRGLSVLAIDLDLEAPGLGFSLLPADADNPSRDRRPKFGVVDYLLENGIGGVSDEDLIDFISPSPIGNSSIDVIPAVGRLTDEHPQLMIQKLSRAFVEDIANGGVVPLWSQIDTMISRFESRRPYDVVLIDARAGLSEITAAPLLGLGAHVLIFGTNQQHTFRGLRFLLAHMMAGTEFETLVPGADWRQNISFVQAKAPASARLRAPFRERLYDLCSELLYDDEDSQSGLSFSADARGFGVPHDSLYIIGSDSYADFDPLTDNEQLDREAYHLAFGNFLSRTISLVCPEVSAVR